jgi:hypothetical protein
MKSQSHRFQRFLLASVILSAASFVASPAQAADVRNIPCGGGGTFKIEEKVINGHNGCAGAIVIPADVIRMSGGAFQRSEVTSVTFEAGSKLKILNGGIFSRTPLASIVLPHGLEKVEYEVFEYTKLKHISIPGTVAWLYGGDFRNTSLETVVFESRTTPSLFLGGDMFSETPNLKSITFKGPNQLRLNEFPAAISADFDWLGPLLRVVRLFRSHLPTQILVI